MVFPAERALLGLLLLVAAIGDDAAIAKGKSSCANSSFRAVKLSREEVKRLATVLIRPYPPSHFRGAGSVTLDIVIGVDAKLKCAVAIKGHPLLREAAIQAAIKWEFEPVVRQQRQREARGLLEFHFRAGNDPNHLSERVEHYQTTPEGYKSLCNSEQVPPPEQRRFPLIRADEMSVRAVRKVRPRSDAFKSCRCEGQTLVQILVDEEGRVICAQVISGHPLLRGPALDAARQWEFEPFMIEGVASKVVSLVIFKFHDDGFSLD
jgi:hypothetical protein